MAVTIRVRNAANTLIAQADLPDAVTARITDTFVTPQAALDWMLAALREAVRARQAATAREAQYAAVRAAENVAYASFDVDWP